ncbi:hypothetical protein CEUSTIGMA_g5049.t1 [Chlamydomonas eustigma]|uniref:Uncharacterized protein n=1 Tax=Chlamydomonas eustigma TaxID=1157962 RepID=A0A250X3G2_9CHLO|nr:hypothetical protein CEUSTIGMA_g5049.t1 [Chlamydomonas eustigma]|eukprot:GAX77605.1 hypothetical protein CEUSTIGMA_g5049.t1 [Chlamydomonas eustigma]
MFAGGPGLSRAISDCTQPRGSANPSSLVLDKYLSDPSTIDATYQALILRAWTEPQSVAVVEKVVSLFKQCILKYIPSIGMLLSIERFCEEIRDSVPLQTHALKSLKYLQGCLQRLRTVSEPSQSSGLSAPLRGAISGTGDGSKGAIKASSHSRYASHTSLASLPSEEVWENNVSSKGAQVGKGEADEKLEVGGPDMMPSWRKEEVSFSVGLLPEAGNHGFQGSPAWAVQGPGVAFRATPSLPRPPGAVTSKNGHQSSMSAIPPPSDASWLRLLPDLNPCFSQPQQGDGEVDGSTVVSLSTLLKCVLDTDPNLIPIHLAEVSGALKAEVALNGKPSRLSSRPQQGKRGGWVPAPRTLFRHQPYNHQEALWASEEDIGVVVEVVLGAAAASSLSPAAARTLSLGAEGEEILDAEEGTGVRPEGAEQDPGGYWESQFKEEGIGQACCAILLKLVMDLYIKAGPGCAYPLVLRMLYKSLLNSPKEARSRAFDLLYNLAVHASLLHGDDIVEHTGGADFGERESQSSTAETPTPIPKPDSTRQTAPSPRVFSQELSPPVSPLKGTSPHSASPRSINDSIAEGAPPAYHHQTAQSPSFPPLLKQSAELELRSAEAGVIGSTASHSTPMDSSERSPLVASSIPGGDWVKRDTFLQWLRAILFPLLCVLCETEEIEEDVWQAGLGCMLQLTTHQGFFVTAWVEALPLRAMSGLLRACVTFNWSEDLYCLLLRLACHLLILDPDQSAAAAATPGLVSSKDPTPLIATTSAPLSSTVRLHRAPGQPHWRSPSSTAIPSISTSPAPLGRSLVGNSSTNSSSKALKFPSPGASPGRTAAGHPAAQLPSPPLGVPLAFGGLPEVLEHLARAPSPDSRLDLLMVLLTRLSPGGRYQQIVVSFAEALNAQALSTALQVAVRCPRPGLASRVVEAVHVCSPDLVKVLPDGPALLAGVLGEVEGCVLAALDGVEEIVNNVQATVAHIQAASSGPSTHRPTAEWQAFKELCKKETASARQLAVHWLHQMLSHAFLVCQTNLLALSPLSLKQSPAGSWRSMLADTMLHVVRVVNGGCELLLQASIRAISELRGTMMEVPGAGSPLTAGEEGLGSSGGGSALEGEVAGTHMAMSALHVTLLWVLQSGDARSMSAIHSLADLVLTAACCPATAHGRTKSTHGPAPDALQMHSPLPIAAALLAGELGLSSQVLQATPTELLVLLLQQCSQHKGSGSDNLILGPISSDGCCRGFSGRPSELKVSTAGVATTAAYSQPEDASLNTSVIFWNESMLERRLALLLALMSRCALDADAFAKHSLAHVIKDQLSSDDARERYLAGLYLLHHWMLNQPHKYWQSLRQLVSQAQRSNDDTLLRNPYVQISAMMIADDRLTGSNDEVMGK